MEQLDCYLTDLTRSCRFSGVVLVVARGTAVYAKAYDFASRKWAVPNSLETRFANASVTKMFTAVAVLQLVEKGEIRLETKLVEYLGLRGTEIPSGVCVSHLLTHTSGIGDYFDETQLQADEYSKIWLAIPSYSVRELRDFLPLFASRPPNFPPGQRFHYCNAGYVLLGLVIEKASGQSYFDYVKDRVFAKAGARGADFLPLDSPSGGVAEGHIPIENEEGRITGWKLNIYSVPVRGAADGGAIAGAYDLAKFMKAVRNGSLLSKEMTKAFLTPQVRIEEDDTFVWQYGYGNWFALGKDGSIICYGHPGEDPGASARVYHYPSQDLDVVVLANQSGRAGPVHRTLREMIMRGEIAA